MRLPFNGRTWTIMGTLLILGATSWFILGEVSNKVEARSAPESEVQVAMARIDTLLLAVLEDRELRQAEAEESQTILMNQKAMLDELRRLSATDPAVLQKLDALIALNRQ